MRALAILVLFLFAPFLVSRDAEAFDCSTIASRICTLDPNYDGPIPSSGNYMPPSCQNVDPITPAKKMFIISAINQAKGKLQKDLCSLTQIVIMRNSSRPSWGFWENPVYHDGVKPGGMYIAINSDDLNRTFSAKQDANNDPNSKLLKFAIGNHQEKVPENVVPELYGLLYVLAHELGHIKWHQSLNNPSCQTAILHHPWSDITTNQPRWTQFAENDFGVRDRSQIPWPQDVKNSKDLLLIYYGGFATALASASPEEDFVESYAINGVSQACDNKCTFQYIIDQDNTVKLNDNRGSSDLGGKFSCTGNLTSVRLRMRSDRY
jgi:hypothetical protein